MEEETILDSPEKEKKEYTFHINTLTWVLIILVLAGYLFKSMHWPFAGFLILFPSLLLCGLFLYKFFKRKEKRITDFLMLVIVAVWLLLLFISYSNFFIALFEK
jgi:hypothetical protein